MSLTKVTNSMIDGAPVNVLDWIPVQYHAAIKNLTSTVDVQQYIQAAMDSGAGELYFPLGWYLVRSPLYITNGVPGSNQSADLTFVGENRTTTYIVVDGTFTSSSIVDPITGVGIKSILINQSDNGKFTLKNIRFQGSIPLGHIMYSYDMGTISSTTTQCLFSGLIENCWFSLATTNNGYFVGGIQNYQISNNVFEQAKGCFRLAGPGCGDINFVNNSLYACYDGFIDGTYDNLAKNLINVANLNVYGYLRGPVFSANNAHTWNITNVTLQGDLTGTLGTIGLTDFIDSQFINIDGFTCYDALNDVVKLSGTSMKISNGFIEANNSGIYMAGNSASNVTIDNVDIKESTTSCFYHPSDTPSGTIKITNCAWYDSRNMIWLDQPGPATYDVTFENCRFTNAGYPNTNVSSRNFAISTSGNVNFYNCLIGKSILNALAYYYIDANGTGDFVLTDCTFTPLIASHVPETTGTQLIKFAGGLGNRYRQYYKSVVPSTGAWNAGDRIFNSQPIVGQPKGWICTVAGTTTGVLSTVVITGTAGQFSCATSSLVVGQAIVISGTFGGTGSITGYTDPKTYYIVQTNGVNIFTLSNSLGGVGVVTTAGTPTGLTYTPAAPTWVSEGNL